MDHILADMFRRHLTDPDRTPATALRDRLDTVAVAPSAETQASNAAMVRGRLAGSATIGLRDRLARQTLSTPRV